MRKGNDVQRVVSNCLVDENLISDDDIMKESSNPVEQRRIELQEKEKRVGGTVLNERT